MCQAVYIHIPFCIRKCSYCDFNSTDTPEISHQDYTNLLIEEIRSSSGVQDVATIYFGGGTPSLLPPAAITNVIAEISRCCGMLPQAEVTLEANPGTVNRTALQGYVAGGVNRLSLGVQSLADRDLAFLGRIHSSQEARSAFAAARAAGFTNIGIDLIHSLPGQTVQEWHSILAAVIAMKPEHISAYGLTIESGTPLAALLETGQIAPQDEDLSAELFELTADLLQRAGYEHYEISNFALPGYRSRHNQIYWQRGNYRGFGAGAHSFQREPLFGARWANGADISSYKNQLTAGNLPARESLTREDAMAEFFFLGLRLLEGVDLRQFATEFGEDAELVYPGVIDRFVSSGLLRRSGANLQLTAAGVLLSNTVLAEFTPSP